MEVKEYIPFKTKYYTGDIHLSLGMAFNNIKNYVTEKCLYNYKITGYDLNGDY
jgi:hypothetical protein